MARSNSTNNRKVKKATALTQLQQIAQQQVLSQPRRLRMPRYESLKFKRRIKHPVQLSSGWNILKRAITLLRANRKIFLGIVIIFGIFNIVLVQGFGNSSQIQTIKHSFGGFLNGGFGQLATGTVVFAFLVASSGNSASSSGAYQTLLIIIISLVLIWTLRQINGSSKISIKEAFYESMTPLIPFVIVLFIIALQLIPLYIGSQLYSLVVSNGIAVLVIEKVLWGMLLFLTALLSMYMLSSSIFALYIVTLPHMTPFKALRSARELVRYRRWTVMRKLLYLAAAILLIALIIMIPIITFITPVAQYAFFVISMIAIALVHAYIYTLYRDLLVEKVAA